jgi:hypothetical protein
MFSLFPDTDYKAYVPSEDDSAEVLKCWSKVFSMLVPAIKEKINELQVQPKELEK